MAGSEAKFARQFWISIGIKVMRPGVGQEKVDLQSAAPAFRRQSIIVLGTGIRTARVAVGARVCVSVNNFRRTRKVRALGNLYKLRNVAIFGSRNRRGAFGRLDARQ